MQNSIQYAHLQHIVAEIFHIVGDNAYDDEDSFEKVKKLKMYGAKFTN